MKHASAINGEAISTIDLDTLETVAAWKADLQARIGRARLRFELCGLDLDEQDCLAAEVDAFKRVCSCLAWPERSAA
jgi:hypothetical protein